MKNAVSTAPKKALKTPEAARPKSSGLGLEGIGDLSSLLTVQTPAANGSGPTEFDLSLIDEDPNQPRHGDSPGFSKESLEELAETIRHRGVKTPISLRDNPEEPGRFLINHGARRTRASKLAGKKTIPGFLDNDYNQADQVIENLQRNDLTAREIADYIGRELAKGIKKGDIAKGIGKSPAFVTQHVTLLDLPDAIAQVFNSGRSRDVTVINELVTASKKRPQEVADWVADEDQEITRGSVKLLREFLDDKRRREEEGSDDDGGRGDGDENEREATENASETKPRKAAIASDPTRIKKAVIQVTHAGRLARLQLSRRPTAEGCAWLKYEDDGHEFETALAGVKLVALIEG